MTMETVKLTSASTNLRSDDDNVKNKAKVKNAGIATAALIVQESVSMCFSSEQTRSQKGHAGYMAYQEMPTRMLVNCSI